MFVTATIHKQIFELAQKIWTGTNILGPVKGQGIRKFRLSHQLSNDKYTLKKSIGTLKSVCSSWFGLISRDKYEHTHLRVPIKNLF